MLDIYCFVGLQKLRRLGSLAQKIPEVLSSPKSCPESWQLDNLKTGGGSKTASGPTEGPRGRHYGGIQQLRGSL